MARAAKTPQQRTDDVRAAYGALRALLAHAEDAAAKYGYDSPEARSAFERVEMEGAVIHRQARRLAGKSRAG